MRDMRMHERIFVYLLHHSDGECSIDRVYFFLRLVSCLA